MILSTGKLTTLSNALLTQSEFARLTNPMENQAFASDMSRLRERIPADGSALPLTDKNLFTNPLLSAAWSVGSLLVSNIKGPEKVAGPLKSLCVVDFASRTSRDKEMLDSELGSIQQHAIALNADLKRFFVRYTGRVGYAQPWEVYRTQAITKNPAQQAASSFFEPLKAVTQVPASEPSTLADIRADIADLRHLVGEYDALLREAQTYFGNSTAMMNRYRSFDCAPISDLRARMDRLYTAAQQNQESFKTEWMNDIGFEARAHLNRIY